MVGAVVGDLVGAVVGVAVTGDSVGDDEASVGLLVMMATLLASSARSIAFAGSTTMPAQTPGSRLLCWRPLLPMPLLSTRAAAQSHFSVVGVVFVFKQVSLFVLCFPLHLLLPCL